MKKFTNKLIAKIKRITLHKFQNFFNFFGLELIRKIPEPPVYEVSRIIDIGVATGTPELINNYPDCYFILIEPNPNYFEYIENIILKRIKGILIKFGVGDKNEKLELMDNGLNSSFFERDYNNNSANKFVVNIKPLDQILEEIKYFKDVSPTILKIDTEGFELNVLKGAKKLLSSKSLKYVILELRISFINNNYNPSDIFVFLNEYGFKFLRIDNIAYKKKGISYLDVTFSR